MVPYYGDFAVDATVYIPINTFDSNDPAASVTVTNLLNTDVHIHKDGGTTQRNNAAGITMMIDYDSITGNHLLIIDTSDNTVVDFYQAGHEYQVRVEGITVDGGTINAWVGAFSIERANGALARLKAVPEVVLDSSMSGEMFTRVPWNSDWDGEIQSEVEDGLTAYEAAKSGELAGTDSRIVSIEAEINKIPKSDGAVTWNSTARATIESEVTEALNAYDPPTYTEMANRTLAAADYATSGELAGADSRVSTLSTEVAKIPKSDGTATWNATALASIQSESSDALTAYKAVTSGELAATNSNVDAVRSVTSKLDTALVADGAVYQYTANSLELSPTGSTPAAIADAVLEELLADHKGVAGSLAKAIHEINQNINPVKLVINRINKTVAVYDTDGETLLFTLTMGTSGSVDTITRA